MKIYYENLDKFRLSRNGNFIKRNDVYIYKESCKRCGDPYLTLMCQPSDFCSNLCANFEKIFSTEHKENLSKSAKTREYSDEGRERRSELTKGKNNPRYTHGLSKTKEYRDAMGARRRARKLGRVSIDADMGEIRKIYKICSDMNNRAKDVDLPKRPYNGAWFHVDHIIPLSKGGLHHQDNLQILWWIDNFSERTKTIKKGGYQYPFIILFRRNR